MASRILLILPGRRGFVQAALELLIALVSDEVLVRRADGRVIEQVPKVAAVRDSAEALARAH